MPKVGNLYANRSVITRFISTGKFLNQRLFGALSSPEIFSSYSLVCYLFLRLHSFPVNRNLEQMEVITAS